MKNNKRKLLTTVLPIALSAVLALLCLAGIVKRPDKWIQDSLYQEAKPWSGRIVVIGIDEKALEEIGPYSSWDRSVVASALEALASDPEHLPAVVAVDTLYSGTSAEGEADARLAQAVKNLGCVVSASAGQIGSQVREDENGRLYYAYHQLLAYDEPFEALADASAAVGHINAEYDLDGIMRHGVLKLPEESGVSVYSMAYEIARLYGEKQGIAVTEPPVDARSYWYVDYSGKPGAYYDSVSVADLIAGRVDPSYYEDRIVLIGPYASGLQDSYFTSIDRAQQMYGVEFQANEIEAILDGRYKTEVPDALQALILFVIAAICGYLFFAKFKLRGSSILGGAVIILGIVAGKILYEKGLILHPLWLPVTILILYLVSVGLRYILSVIEKQKITRTFERYVAPEIVKDILREGTESLGLGGRVVDIAVLFVDVRGFTTMSERLKDDPEKVVNILNRYLTRTSDAIERNKGTLDKYVGDCAMAFWGAPFPQEHAVYNAVKTALEIIEGANAVSKELTEEMGEELHVGVGVHFGKAVVGNMGSEKHMDYTAIGDTVNTAARLEANAPGGTVYVSRAVADQLGDLLTYSKPDHEVKLKGKEAGFEVLVVEELKPLNE